MCLENKKILVTGGAGFIGSALAKALHMRGYDVTLADNLNSYYDPDLKLARLRNLGFNALNLADISYMEADERMRFHMIDISDTERVEGLFRNGNFDIVVNLAAQAGVRYSLENPQAYIDSNVTGFLNILQSCRDYNVEHLVYASSSSVYGLNSKAPFAESDTTDRPASIYAATKKSNELFAHVFSHLYGLPCTGLRFFTVYGPWGRPDMAPSLFMDAIADGRPLKVFNHGNMLRDFTYIDDIVEGVVRAVETPPARDNSSGEIPYRIYNIGSSHPVKLMDFISAIEKAFGKEGNKIMLDMQPGDVEMTFADTGALQHDLGYAPSTPFETGIERTVDWFKKYYRK